MKDEPVDPAARLAWRFRLVACCLVLTALAFSQRPGRIASDTKLDLVVDPGAMLGRALHMWDPLGAFGQVQNQAYGYLFPMGPFFWLGQLASVDGWVTQRLWWSLLLVVAFTGTVQLAGALGLGSPTSRIVAGFAYALSPRILTTIGPISIEAWPSAVAPWVLLPLVLGSQRGSARRAAALSALAVAAVGGVNASATFSVVPLAALWILTRERGPRRSTLLRWWPGMVLLGTAWWLVPLVLLGQYSPPFLDYIETASVTTLSTTLFDALRGTSHWVAYVDPIWTAGNDLVATGYVALNSAVLLLVGLVGVTRRANPHRQFLVLAVLVGLLLVTVGHSGALQGWLGEAGRSALDGVLAPLRNVHKFDPVIRLPLVLGLAYVVGELGAVRAEGRRWLERSTWRSEDIGDRVAHVGVLVLVVTAVAGVAGPALAGRLPPRDDIDAVPAYWASASDWLAQQAPDTTALLVPGSSFATYQWGNPEDEPLQAFGGARWAVRNAVPLAPAGNIRMLDAIQSQLAAGRPSPALAAYLRRAGIGHLVVRNDLVRQKDRPAPVAVHQALEGSPGLSRVKTFGPLVRAPVMENDEDDDTRLVYDDGWSRSYPAVEVFEVDGAREAVLAPQAPLVVGGPENLLDLMEAGLLGDLPSRLAVDTPEGPEGQGLLLTDGLRRQEVNFARLDGNRSATLTGDDPGRRGAPARDYGLGGAEWETQATVLGARYVDASSSRAFADTSGPVQPGSLPFAAFDGDVRTAWSSGPPESDVHPWVEVGLDEPLDVSTVTVVFGDVGDREQVLRVITDQGISPAVRGVAGETASVAVSPGLTSAVRVVGAGELGQELVVAEVRVPDLDVDRSLVLPSIPASWGAPDGIVLSSPGGRPDCVEVGSDVRCGPDRHQDSEEALLDRTLELGRGAAYEVSTTARPVQSDALQGLMQQDRLVNARASSTLVDDPRASAVAAIDGARGTTWLADPDDPAPSLSLNWIGARTITGIQLQLDGEAAAVPAARVHLEYAGGAQTVALGRSGSAQVKPFRSSRVELTLLGAGPGDSQLADGSTRELGVGVSEVRLEGLALLPAPLSTIPRDIGCGFGPPVRIGDELFATSVIASPRELFDRTAVPARVCGPAVIELESGATRVVMAPAPAFRPERVVLESPLWREAAGPTAAGDVVAVSDLSPVEREVDLGASTDGGLLSVSSNQNPGWVATDASGEALPGLTVDGWQQAWRVPADADGVTLRFGPGNLYRAALLGGGVLLLGLVLAAATPRGATSAPPLASRRLPSLALPAAALLVLGSAAGWWAVACGALGALVAAVARRYVGSGIIAWGSGVPLLAAAVVYAQRPIGSPDGWAGALMAPQLLVAFAVGALVVSEERHPRFFNRIRGFSISR